MKFLDVRFVNCLNIGCDSSFVKWMNYVCEVGVAEKDGLSELIGYVNGANLSSNGKRDTEKYMLMTIMGKLGI